MKSFLALVAVSAAAAVALAQWEQGPELKNARTGHTVTTLLDGSLLVVGGYNEDGECLNTAEVFDPFSNLWTITGNLVYARCHHAAVLVDDGTGRVLVTGGLNASGSALASTEFYDPDTNAWTSQPNDAMRTARAFHASIRLARGDVLVIGGYNDKQGYLFSVEQFRVDTATSPWNPVGDLKVARANHTATLLPNDRILVVGGVSNGTDIATGEVCSNLIYCTWVLSTNTLTTPRHFHIATLLLTGDVLIAGGLNNGAALFTSEIYDNTHFREIAGELTTPRFDFATAVLLSGEVIAVGGRESIAENSFVDTIELYNPTTRRWARGGLGSTINQPRAGHTASLLPNGVVLIAGGSGQRLDALASTELYDPEVQRVDRA